MRSLFLAALSLSLALPSAALACGGGEDMTTLGSAAFTADGRISALAVRKHGYEWLTIEKDGSFVEERGHLGVHHTYGVPRMRTNGELSLAQVDQTLFHEGLLETSGTALSGIITYDALLSADPAIAVTLVDENGAIQLAVLERAHGELVERGRLAVEGACPDHILAVTRVGGTVTGLCGDVPFRLDGNMVSLEPPLGAGAVSEVVSAGFAADGSAVFFAAVSIPEPYRMQLTEIRRTAFGAWTVTVMAELAIGYGFEGGLAAAGTEQGAVAGFDEYGTFSLHAFFRVDGEWKVETVASLAPHDRLSAYPNPIAGGAPQILAGAYDLTHYERGETGSWTHTALPRIGKFFPGDMGGCSVAGTSSAPSIGGLLSGIAGVALALVVRRRAA